MTEIIGDLIKILLPAAAVMYAMFLVVRSFLNGHYEMMRKEYEKKLLDLKVMTSEKVLPLRLQAYERMCLFLERISLHNLVLRLNNPAYNSMQFQQKLLMEIREEYNHNLSQQLYMSDQSWALVKNAMEEVIAVINKSAGSVPGEARSVDLAKMIFENMLQKTEDPTSKALKFVKNEIRQIF
ncbi:MAG: hypothetical protein ACJ75J_08290 [Cytophagaceae bacterium]